MNLSKRAGTKIPALYKTILLYFPVEVVYIGEKVI